MGCLADVDLPLIHIYFLWVETERAGGLIRAIRLNHPALSQIMC